MRVVKFGGTSVGSIEALERVIEILRVKQETTPVAVVSAFSGMTDGLIGLARQARSGDAAYKKALQTMKDRHRKTADFFLRDAFQGIMADIIATHNHTPPLEDAFAHIEADFGELARMLEGIAIVHELSPRCLDEVMSFGERLSASLLARILTGAGVPAEYLDTRRLIKTDDSYGNARCLMPETLTAMADFFQSAPQKLYIAAGFIGSTLAGATTTLGRGGSDLTAAIFGAAMGAEEVEIWTDVDGIMTADPRLVKNAFRIEVVSYVEAMELSHFGAKVLYAPTIKPAMEQGIPLSIRNTFDPSGGGTLITKECDPGEYPIRGISSLHSVALVRVQGSGMVGVAGFASRLFGALARKNINVILITQGSSEYSICFAVQPEDTAPADAALREEFSREIAGGAIDEPIAEQDLAIIAVVGAQMQKTPGISGKIFHALGRNGISITAIAQGSSELNISAVIPRADEAKALNAIHEAFFRAGLRSVNLFLAGTGLVGGTLLDQIGEHREALAKEHQVRINLVGAANSRYMVFNPDGLDPQQTKALLKSPSLQAPAAAFSLPVFLEKMRTMNLPNTAFCDCTANDHLAAAYADILGASIPIVTPNKRANSGSFAYYDRLISYSKARGVPYLYEVTVCAGLPVISTLRDLFLSGDRVRRIEAVVSGTLSYIFNNFDGSKPFSALVREAKTKGYTEPDPRDDLNAMDAARKALILARECGTALEFSGVAVEPLLPKACVEAPTVDAFFAELEKCDAAFEKRRAQAAAEGKALRYVAVIENGSARLSLRGEPAGSPFRLLVDADNMVVITSDRYCTLPMVIKGPGAGAQVTAGGVLADIVRLARTLV